MQKLLVLGSGIRSSYGCSIAVPHGFLLPNVTDEPRLWLARRLRSRWRDSHRRWIWRLVRPLGFSSFAWKPMGKGPTSLLTYLPHDISPQWIALADGLFLMGRIRGLLHRLLRRPSPGDTGKPSDHRPTPSAGRPETGQMEPSGRVEKQSSESRHGVASGLQAGPSSSAMCDGTQPR